MTASFVSRELYPYLYPYKTITFGVKMKLLSPEWIDFTTFPNKLALSNIVQIPASPLIEPCNFNGCRVFFCPNYPTAPQREKKGSIPKTRMKPKRNNHRLSI